MDGSCSDDSEIEEERAGGAQGPGPTGGGPEQEDRGRIRPTTSIRNAGRAFTNRTTAETLRVQADIACVTYICTWAVTNTRKWYWLFLDQSDFKVMPLNRRFERRIKGTATSVAVSSFELNPRVLLLHLSIQT